MKPSNMFFLVTLFLLCIPQISPFNPYTYLFAFVLVTGTSIVKDGVEDYRKHKQDEKINHKKTFIVEIKEGLNVTREINVESLDVGDFVIVQENEDIPADVILLRSKISTKKGNVCKDFCYVDSSNLDGESNLKKKTSQHDIECNKEKGDYKDKGNKESNIHTSTSSNPSHVIICDCDNFFIGNVKNPFVIDTGDLFTKFDCELKLNEELILCNEKNVLLKGMKLKNTKSVLAYVVAVGKDTKMGKSNITTRKGHSLFEGEVSKLVYVIFALYFLLLFVSSLLGSLFLRKNNIEYLYLDDFLAKDALKQTGTNYIMFSYLIPLSLFVTLEVSRMFHAAYISHDLDLKKEGVNSVCRNSSVTEDLGMIEYVLCDKTGTLTKNNMVFKYVHLSGSSELEGQFQCFEKGSKLGGRKMDGSKLEGSKRDGSKSNESKRNGGKDLNQTSLTNPTSLAKPHNKSHEPSLIISSNPSSLTNAPISHPTLSNTTLTSNQSLPITHHPKFMFILALTCCNGIDFLNNKYEGISQDEISILEGFKMNNIRLLERSDSHILLEIYGERFRIYTDLTLDFTSSRQRMSILVRWNERCFLFTKGSDTKLLNKIIKISEEEGKTLFKLIENNAKYRTLVVGFKELSKRESNNFINRFNEISLENRYQQEEDIFEEYEKSLNYLGTTFIEDELQEEVGETLSSLKKANIKIWMITGDKKETAMSCAIDCGIMDSAEDTSVLLIEGKDFDIKRVSLSGGGSLSGEGILGNNVLENEQGSQGNNVLSSEQGNNLNSNNQPLFNNHPPLGNQPLSNNHPPLGNQPLSNNHPPSNNHPTLNNFFDYTAFKSVVVFRSTPHMKGKIALKFREIKRNTLAIGDGNNDVGMLQTANIGIGILGKEGNQAGIAGDFAVPGFSCLRKLILVHGRYNFIRFSKVTLNAFQKNIYFITIQFLYNFYNGFSGRPVYNSYFLNYYNVFFTSLVPATIALFDKDIPEDEAFKSPERYTKVRDYFSKNVLIFSTLYSIFEGIVTFILVTGIFFKNDLISSKGKVGGYPGIQNVFSLIVFTSVLLEQINLVSFITIYTYWAIGLSIGLCFISLFLLGDSMWNLVSIPSFYFLFMMLILVSYILGLMQDKFLKVIRGGVKEVWGVGRGCEGE